MTAWDVTGVILGILGILVILTLLATIWFLIAAYRLDVKRHRDDQRARAEFKAIITPKDTP